MPQLQLLSNGKYHVVLAPSGSGRSRWNDVAITRWREDAALGCGGAALFVRDEDGSTWSPTDGEDASERSLHARVEAAVARDDDVELRRLRLINATDRDRDAVVTSFLELALAAAATDSAHPAFNKLFVVTEIDLASGMILATHRRSAPGDAMPWVFHQAVADCARGEMSFETDRMQFVGRGREVGFSEALQTGAPLGGHDGSVLDPIAAVRVSLRLRPGACGNVDWTTGAASTRADCIAMARRCRDAGAGDRILAGGRDFRAQTLRRLGASDDDAAMFERLAASVLVADPRMRAAPSEIARNRRGQTSLWAFGISGDLPIIVVEVDNADAIVAARQMLRAHAFWRAHGLDTELLVLHGRADAADGALQGRILAEIDATGATADVGRPGGVFLHERAHIDEADRLLLRSVARIVADGRECSPADLAVPGPRWPAPVVANEEPIGSAAQPPATAAALVADNGHGGFSVDGREYVITTARSWMTPLPWTNVIANPGFGTIVSESGSGSTWSENSHEFRLTPWSNDPVSDASGEAIYIRDEETGDVWSPTLLPTRSATPTLVRHGFGYSTFEHSEHDIATTLRIHVALDQPVKFSTLALHNRSSRPRRLSVTGYVEWVLGDERAKTLLHIVTEFDPGRRAVLARNAYSTDFGDRTALFAVDADAGDGSVDVCADRGEFFGGGGRAAPAALAAQRWSGAVGGALDACAALRVSMTLAPGHRCEVVFRLAAAGSDAEARALAASSAGRSAETFSAVRAEWGRTLGSVQVRTPDAGLNALANGWLLYQVISSRLWGRTAFYQSSGAYGFRDQLQDAMALVHARPALAREHLLRAAARQFEDGDVQHWWHPPSGKGIRTRCSDDYLWLPIVTCRYVEVTGDVSVLDEPSHFVQGRALKDGEASNYEQPSVSAATASLYEHCRRALVHSRPRGAHGLPLMGSCDWNDGMNLIGIGGRGESVWLAFFLIAVLERFASLALARGDDAFSASCNADAATLRGAVEANAWDGNWYLRAWFDDGSPVGAAANRECKIDSIAQSWAVLSAAASPERAAAAMDSLHRHLVRPEARVVQLLDPPFDVSDPWPGYIQGYVPGVRENGGQYTHGAIWAALAFVTLGDRQRAWQLFDLLDPVRHGDSAARIAIYKTEPYVMAGDVYAIAPHAGRGGWTWYTGSAGWMYQLIVEGLLGLKRAGSRLALSPLLPDDWDGFELRYRFGAT
ncbi:MAG TPA: cyclic beta 1-2 glucan synthetase, partial [Caldimonas sp.]